MFWSARHRLGYVALFVYGCCITLGSVNARNKRGTESGLGQAESISFPEDEFEEYDPFFDATEYYDFNGTNYGNFTTYPPYEAANPGFRARVTHKALDYATTLAIDIMMSQIRFISIPDIEQTIGNIDVQVSRVRFVRFDRPKAQFVPHPGSGISLRIWNLNVKVMASYEAQMGLGFFGTIEKSGTLSVRAKDLSLSVKLHLEKQPWTGLPSKLTPICSSSGELIITFKGGWSDLLNVGSSVFATTIRSLIASQVCSAAQTEIDKNLNTLDGLLQLNQTIAGLFDFHFTMTEFPAFTDEFVESSHMGTTYYVPQWEEPPFMPSPIPSFEEHTDRMFYVYVTDYVLNSAFHAGHMSGLLNYNVTSNMIPSQIPPQFRQLLSTTCESPLLCLGILYPGLATHFPGGTVSINTYSTEAPNVTFYDGHSVRVKTSGNLEFFVDSYGQVSPAFGLGFTISIDVSLVVKNNKISFRLNDLSPSVDILYTNVGDVGTSFFYETIIKTGLRAALPYIEEFGEKGLDIPELLNLKIENSEIIVIEEQGVFVVATDVKIIIPQGINLIAMLGPDNDTVSNSTMEDIDVAETTSYNMPSTTTTRQPAREASKTSRPKSKRRRNRNGRRRKTTPTTTNATTPTVALEQSNGNMSAGMEWTVSGLTTERVRISKVPKAKTRRRAKKPRSRKVQRH